MISIIATCPEETKDILEAELEELGAQNIAQTYRAVTCDVNERQFYEAHLKLRTASRILKVIKSFSAKHENMLFSQAKRIKWDELFSPNQSFIVEATTSERGSEFMTGNTISKRVREALQDVFNHKLNTAPKVDLKNPGVIVVAFQREGRCMISIDTCGKALHKRGYKTGFHPAPLKETLAAAILRYAEYDGNEPLWDPMCGSGTLVVEAAYIALNKAPMIHRKKGEFAFERLLGFNRNLWREVQDQARLERLEEPKYPIWASDISGPFVDMAQTHALAARVEKHINFSKGRFQDQKPFAPKGLIVSNLPFGERLEKDSLEDLAVTYKEIGDCLKHNFSGWRCALLAAIDSPFKAIGLKPKRKIPIKNGSIECRLLLYDLYDGSRR